ncbi:MAG: glycosyl hydrolase [Kosmotogaceae bacterium]
MKNLIILVLILFSSLVFGVKTVTINQTGMKIVSETKWNKARTAQTRKDAIFMSSNIPLILIKTRIEAKDDFINKIDLERIETRDLSSEFELLTYKDGIYLSQIQNESNLLPAKIENLDKLISPGKLRTLIAEKTEIINFTEYDPLSGQSIVWEYKFTGNNQTKTEIGTVECLNYQVSFSGNNTESIFKYNKNGDLISGEFMSSEIYNIEYFPSKDIDQNDFDYETREISPYLFANNYWKETSINNSLAYVRASSINMIRWGGIYRDEVPRNSNDYAVFKEFIDYTSIEPLVQLEYFSKQSAIDQYEEVLSFMPSTKYISFSNEANIYPSIVGKSVSINEFNEKYRDEIGSLKEKYSDVVVIGPDFTISNLPQYDKWLTEFFERNGSLIDVLSLHYYPFDGSQSEKRTLEDIDNLANYIEQVKSLLSKYNMEDIPIAITETNTSYDYRIKGPGDPSTFISSIWLASAYITAIEEKLWSFQHWCLVDDGTLSLMNNIDGLVEYRPTARIYLLFSDFTNEYIPTNVNTEKIKAVFSPNKDLNSIVGVIVNYNDEKKSIAFEKSGDKIQLTESLNADFDLPEKSITLVYLNYNLKLIQKKVYADQN